MSCQEGTRAAISPFATTKRPLSWAGAGMGAEPEGRWPGDEGQGRRRGTGGRVESGV